MISRHHKHAIGTSAVALRASTQSYLTLVLLIGIFAAWLVRDAGAAPVQRPNVVFILLDNLGQEWLGCYGSDEKRTPNLDKLAATGVRFEHCYTPCVCGPSRTVLLTGRYLLRSGFTLHHDAALYGGGGLDPDRETVFARLFRSAGYKTGIAGKWQINNLYDEPGILTRHGFDEQLVWPGSIDPAKTTPDELSRFQAAIAASDVPFTSAMTQKIESRYWDPVLLRGGLRETDRGRFGPDVLQEFALDYLTRHRGEPFLLYYPMVLTHGQTHLQPVVPTPLNLETDRPHHEMYGDMVEYADRLIGQVVAKLDELGLRENTYLFVATDNGTEHTLTASCRGKPVHGGLYELTEAGGDVGLVANCPTRIPGGRTIPLADFSDVLPTLCELAGIRQPGDRMIDGKSQAAALLDPSVKPPREWIFNQYGDRRCVRDRQYKFYSTGELYDVEADRGETTNIAGYGEPAIVAEGQKLAAILASMPPDAPPPFTLRSQSAFKLRQAAKQR